MRVRANITGNRYGKLMAINPVGISKRGRVVWLCRCDCGKTKTVDSNNLQSGHTRSCGCLVSERRFTTEEQREKRLAATARWRKARTAHLVSYGRRRALRNHGLTEEQYKELVAKQNGVCALCKKPSPFRLHVDHDHRCCSGVYSCGRCIRGLLCIACNRGLGLFKDDLKMLRQAIDYLEGVGAVETVRHPANSQKIQSELHGNMQSIAEMPMPVSIN